MLGAQSALTQWLRTEEFKVELLLAGSVAFVVSIGVWIELAYDEIRPPAGFPAYAIGLAASAVLVFRRRRPVLVSVVVLVLVLVYRLLGYPGEAPAVVFFVAFYSVTAHGSGARSLLVGLALPVAAELLLVIPPYPQPWYSPAVLAPSVCMASAVILGAAARQRRLAAESALAQSAADAEARLRDALAQERLRIARDLHDVLAHTLSVIAVQTGVALDSLPGSPDQARKAMLTVRSLVREATPQLHSSLGALRGEAEPPQLAPQPGLAQLPGVAEQARAAGLRVELVLPQDFSAVSPFVQLTAYRVVTEALTNVLRHADATSATASVSLAEGTLVIDVCDDGTSPGPAAGGLGLAGMRERVSLADGTVQAGPDPAGGFRVLARIPAGRP
ncbi:sensor histidine kinase [Specibacter cremeus]|uniref:sensor histidine kinase n=1 Tax=Specibacter cremeus TaxID=1629051 RepID=UPI000F76C821|nr:sensor histidine kinase [Specibacter cremeus]